MKTAELSLFGCSSVGNSALRAYAIAAGRGGADGVSVGILNSQLAQLDRIIKELHTFARRRVGLGYSQPFLIE